jgi:hypothetical protein
MFFFEGSLYFSACVYKSNSLEDISFCIASIKVSKSSGA